MRGREVYAFNEIIEEGPAEHSALERGLIVKNGCRLRRGDTIILDTLWLCIPCLPSLNWKDRVRQSVERLDENDALAFKRLQGSHPTRPGSTKRICVTENPEQRFTNNAWTLNDTLSTGRLRERLAVGLHEISFGNHSCSPSVTVSLPCLPDGYTSCGSVKLEVVRELMQGQEVTFTYLHQHDLRKPTSERRSQLKARWKFICQCELCTKPEGSIS